MRCSAAALVVFLCLVGCRRVPQATLEAPDAGPIVLRDLGRLEDPLPVAQAVAQRPDDPRGALLQLQAVWRQAVEARDRRLEAFALDRSGDVVMDLLHSFRGDEPQLGSNQTQACRRATDDYTRAWTLAEQLGDSRLAGRVAHDLAWASERCGDEPRATAWYELALARRLEARDALGVRYTANNLGVLITGPKRRRWALYQLALEAAAVARDPVGQRKAHTNIARLWFYSADGKWLDQDWTDGGPLDGYAMGPLRGEVRQKFLFHLGKAVEAAERANESPWDVCAGLAIEDECSRWSGQPLEELFPEE